MMQKRMYRPKEYKFGWKCYIFLPELNTRPQLKTVPNPFLKEFFTASLCQTNGHQDRLQHGAAGGCSQQSCEWIQPVLPSSCLQGTLSNEDHCGCWPGHGSPTMPG